jgi:basic amino acid/polyamine antiporter, APA family
MANQLFARKPFWMLQEEMKGENRLRRVLGPWHLTALGVGAVIGTGIFVLTGQAAHDKAGPALMLSFVAAGVACIFAALCYAEFASMAPVAGSAYTYAYATLGELFAWIIGWDLVLEYAVASMTVAHGWSKNFQDILATFGLNFPKAWGDSPFDYNPALGEFVSTGAYFDLPAVLIAAAVTYILVKGIRESAGVNTAIVILKVAIVFFVIIVGAFYVNPDNWKPVAPYGLTGLSFFGYTVAGQTDAGGHPVGMLAGAAIIFFAYIGFDSVSTHAEEAINPKKDVPFGIIVSLVLCTILYIAVAGVLTGMVPTPQINIETPVSDAFRRAGLPWARLLVSAGAVAGITSVLLVMMLSQPRVWLAMARDGMVPQSFFGAVHEKYRTPWKATILTGVFVAIGAGLLPLRILADLTNIGTLFAFVVVCAAVLIMRRTHPDLERPFRAPLGVFTPVAGIVTCLILMFSLAPENWLRLFIWLALGLVIYFAYSRKHTVMARYLAGEIAESGVSARMGDVRDHQARIDEDRKPDKM